MPVAFVVLRRPEAMSAADVRALFEGQLADYKHPQDVIFAAEALPRNAIGKVQAEELRRSL